MHSRGLPRLSVALVGFAFALGCGTTPSGDEVGDTGSEGIQVDTSATDATSSVDTSASTDLTSDTGTTDPTTDTGTAECGNAMVEFGEECDDGNTLAGDGCGLALSHE